MVHSPCGARNPGAVCMAEGKCTRGYPKQYTESTTLPDGGYPIYKRRNDGRVFRHQGKPCTNMDVVPYNPHLTRLFDCHINVEICASIQAVKYIHKYIYKGHDRTTMVVGGNNEITQYYDARHVGPPEGTWRVLGYRLHEESPKVHRLAVHLPGEHNVVYQPDKPVNSIKAQAENTKTSLMDYFEYYTLNPDAPAYTYLEFPKHCRWRKTEGRWTTRKIGFAIGRMYFVPPNAGEHYYLRLLLTVVAGARSFRHIRTITTGRVTKVHPTFKSACIELGLLEDDGEWDKCLQEAAVIKLGHQLRQLFGIILAECNPTRPEVLWRKFGKYICDDLPHRLKTVYGVQEPTEEQILDYDLYLLEKILNESGKTLDTYQTMPKQSGNWSNVVGNRLIWENRQLMFQTSDTVVHSRIQKLNLQQRTTFDQITESVDKNTGRTFFLNGSAGTGKTFLYNTVAANCRNKGHIVLTVSSCSVAALLLSGGRTTHSTFKIPLNPTEDSKCHVAFESMEAELFRNTKLIIWDEVAMQHKFCIEAVDRTLRDVRRNIKPFGGIMVVLGGDFKQTLPVVPRGTREEIVSASVRSSYLWKGVNVLKLTHNMRLESGDPDIVEFAKYLLKVGEELEPKIQLPSSMNRWDTLKTLISSVYPAIESMKKLSQEYLTNRTILCPRNDDVIVINELIIKSIRGNSSTYLAADKLAEDGDKKSPMNTAINTETLNRKNPAGIPPFKLELKVGSPIMLLRNIAPSNGLCNKTRLRVEMCEDHVIAATILTGDKEGEMVFIPRISLTPSDTEVPIRMTMRQFPIRLAYAMTINKSQGQSVTFVGIDLRSPVFSHGQLYVALSRCITARRITVLLPENTLDGKTTNVVYPEVLT